MHRATRPGAVGLDIRIARSASPRTRFASRTSPITSRSMFVHWDRIPARRGTSRWLAKTGGAEMRTVPFRDDTPTAAREKAWASSSRRLACLARVSPSGVSDQPFGKRSNSLTPSDCSSASTRRATVECSTDSLRATPERLPTRASSRKYRMSSHCRRGLSNGAFPVFFCTLIDDLSGIVHRICTVQHELARSIARRTA